MQRKLTPSRWIILGLSLAVCGMAAAVFVTPSKADRMAAAGNVGRLDPPLRRAFNDGGEIGSDGEIWEIAGFLRGERDEGGRGMGGQADRCDRRGETGRPQGKVIGFTDHAPAIIDAVRCLPSGSL